MVARNALYTPLTLRCWPSSSGHRHRRLRAGLRPGRLALRPLLAQRTAWCSLP